MKKETILQMSATICSGIFSNPCSGNVIQDSWYRQQLIQSVIQDVNSAVISSGIYIEND
jgi:hypothetical protein